MTDNSYSVIIPCYNAEAFVADAIRSVLSQSVPATEVLVVDDGSHDASADVAAQFEPAVTVIRQANGGVAAARNRGIRAARGTWIAFLDADDLWEADKMERQLARAADGYEFIYSDAGNFGQTGSLPSCRSDYTALHEGMVFERLLVGNFVATSSVLVRRTAVEQTSLFDSRFTPAEDWALWLQLAIHVPFACVPRPLVRYRVHAAGISRNTENLYRGCREILAWLPSLPDLPPISRRTWQRARAAVEARRALGHAMAGNPIRAARGYGLALWQNPIQWYWWKALIRSGLEWLGSRPPRPMREPVPQAMEDMR